MPKLGENKIKELLKITIIQDLGEIQWNWIVERTALEMEKKKVEGVKKEETRI